MGIATKKEELKLEDLDKHQLLAIIQSLSEQIAVLSAELKAAANRTFGTGKERIDPNQLHLFGLGEKPEEDNPEPKAQVTDSPKKPKKGHGRKAFPPHLERREIVIDLPEAERCCLSCGEEMVVIGQEASERADVIPVQIIVNLYVRIKRACPNGHGVSIAPPAPALIDKAKFETSVYAHVAVAKYSAPVR